jgi:hypothetical protein
MTATLTDYDVVLNELLADINRIKDSVSSAVLFGSMARGDVLPGHSDMMDVYVFLNKDVFHNKDRFLNTLEVLAQACEKIADKSPGPFHPFFYWNETDPVPATFNLDITVHSKVIFGEDIRSQIKTNGSSIAVAQTAFFEMRRMGDPLMVYLRRSDLSDQDCQIIFNLLMAIKRDLPMLALMVLDIWVVHKQSIQALRDAMPDIDLEVLDKIVMLQHDEDARMNRPMLLDTFRDAMILVEKLNDRLISVAQSSS